MLLRPFSNSRFFCRDSSRMSLLSRDQGWRLLPGLGFLFECYFKFPISKVTSKTEWPSLTSLHMEKLTYLRRHAYLTHPENSSTDSRGSSSLRLFLLPIPHFNFIVLLHFCSFSTGLWNQYIVFFSSSTMALTD